MEASPLPASSLWVHHLQGVGIIHSSGVSFALPQPTTVSPVSLWMNSECLMVLERAPWDPNVLQHLSACAVFTLPSGHFSAEAVYGGCNPLVLEVYPGLCAC